MENYTRFLSFQSHSEASLSSFSHSSITIWPLHTLHHPYVHFSPALILLKWQWKHLSIQKTRREAIYSVVQGKMSVTATPALLAAVLPSNTREPTLTNVNDTSSSQGPMIRHRDVGRGHSLCPRYQISHSMCIVKSPEGWTIKRYYLIPDKN